MSRFVLPAVLAAFAFVASAPAVDVTIVPDPPAADTPFKIRVEGVSPDSCVPRDPELVIDGNTLEITFRIPEGACLTVITPWSETVDVPPLPAGVYALRGRSVRGGHAAPMFETSFSIGGPAPPQRDWERVLLPIVLTVLAPGAHGSLWITDAAIRNGSGEHIPLDRFPCPVLSPPVLPCPPGFRVLPPGTTTTTLRHTPRGSFWYVPRSASDAVFVSLHAKNVAAPGRPRFQVPVVRERDYLATGTEFPRITIESGTRVLLRVYGDGMRSQSVRMQLFDAETAALLDEAAILLLTPWVYVAFPDEPTYAQVSITPPAGTNAVRIRLEPAEDDRSYWAFVTVTDNETSFVTTYTPSLGD